MAELQKAIRQLLKCPQPRGITLVNESDRNPLHTTTYGVGELIRDAIKRDAANLLLVSGEAQPTMEESVCSRLSATAF